MKRAAVPLALVTILAAAYLLAARRVAGEAGLPLDDAWIHARLARRFAAGDGLVFNAGEPSAVSSAPLWSLLLSLPAAAGVPFPWASYACGIAATVALAIVTRRLLERGGAGESAALAGGLIVVATHPFPWGTVSGMEPPLAAALALGTVLLASSGRTVPAIAVAMLAAGTRPEMSLLPGLVVLDRVFTGDFLRGGRARAWGTAGAALAATAAPFLLNRVMCGRWLYGSFEAKVGRHGVLAALLAGRLDRLPDVILTNLPLYFVPLAQGLALDNAALLILAPFGIRRLWRAGGRTHLLWMIPLLLPAAMAALAPFGGPEFHEQRYVAPVVAAVLAAGCAAIAPSPGGTGRRRLRAAIAVVVVLLSGLSAWRGMGRFGLEVKNIEEMQVRVGRWLAERPGGPGLVATNDIGAIGFITGAPIVDLTGLATPEALPYLRRPPAAGVPARGWNGANEAALLDYLRLRRPRYVAIFPSWYPSPIFAAGLGEPVMRVDLTDNLICGDRTMIVYRPDWN